MMYTVQTLTPEVLVEMFGDTSDWYSVLKNGKRVGTFADLRKQVLNEQARKGKIKLYREDNIIEMEKFLGERIKDAEVFINRSQPNLHINGCKCYITCSHTGKHRLGILHATMTFDDMQQLAEIKGVPSTSNRHILFNNVDNDQIVDLINLLCGE